MTKVEWNHLQEVKPEQDASFTIRYLVWDGRKRWVDVCYWDDDAQVFYRAEGETGKDFDAVTHWAPEPEGPR